MPRSNVAFSEALSRVSSDKIKERAEGMEQLRTIFQSQSSIENLSNVDDAIGWLQTFQTLFGVVKMERDQCMKKGKSSSSSSANSAAETRLSKAMSFVRWLIERSSTYLTKKVINALFNHLTQIIISPDGRLIRNSMDYIKAIKIVVSFAPHLEHLDSALWQHLMSICWDAALGERIEHNKEDWDEDDEDEDATRESHEDEEEDDDDRDVEMASVSGTARKRKLPSTASSSISRHGSRHPANTKLLPLSTEITELLSIVPILLASPNAPVLPPPQFPEEDLNSNKAFPRVGIKILHKVLRFLRERPGETAAHRSVLITLNMVLSELEVNAVQEMIGQAPQLLSLLVPLWNTKLKDQIVISLRIILPFLSSSKFVEDKMPEEKKISREVFNDLMLLRDSVPRTTPGRRTMVLDLSFLTLRYTGRYDDQSKSKRPLPMQTSLIGATSDFTDAMIETWASLELMADSLILLHQHYEATSLRSTATSTGSNKRQRIEEPVAEMLTAITTTRQAESRLFWMQTMYFFITRHWQELHVRLQDIIMKLLHHLVVDPNTEVQQWADINLAAICLVTEPHYSATSKAISDEVVPARKPSQTQDQWLEIWQLGLRKLTVIAGASSRSAALLLQVILKNQIVDSVLLLTSVEKFLEGVSEQGPAAPYESVCYFMVASLDLVDEDARLHRLGFGAKVSAWFRTAWMAQEQVALDTTGRNTFEISSGFHLICRLSGIPVSSQIPTNHRPLTPSPLYTRMERETQILDIRNFILHATLPSLTSHEQHLRSATWAATSEVKPRSYAAAEARALSRLFTLKLQYIDTGDGEATNVARLRGKMDACLLIMLAESSFIDYDSEHSQANFDSTCQLLEKMMVLSLQKNWTLPERATLFTSINALFPYRAEHDAKHEVIEPLLCSPGSASGILSIVTAAHTPEERPSVGPGEATAVPLFYQQLWRKPKLYDLFRSRVPDFHQVLQSKDLYGDSHVSGGDSHQLDDDFDAIKVDEESTQNTPSQTLDQVAKVIIDCCIRFCLLPKFFYNDKSLPVKDRNILNILIDSDPALFLKLCDPIHSAVRNGFLEYNDDAAGTIYEILQEYLSSYTYSLSSVMRQAAITLVDTILHRLPPMADDSFHGPSGEAAAGLLDWLGANLKKGKLQSWADRLSVIRLYARLIELDPGNISWSRRRNDNPRNDDTTPVSLLCEIIEDSDARVRFRLTVIISRLFQILPGRNFAALYREALDNLFIRGFQVECILTNLLFFLNITCVTAVGRFNALFHVYDTAYMRAFTRSHALVGLQAVVRALRLANIAELYLQYATRIAQLQFNEDQTPENLPMQLYGFQTRKEWAKEALSSVGPVALTMNKTWVWEHLCEIAGLSKDEGLQRIFSVTFGYRLAKEVDQHMQTPGSEVASSDITKAAKKYENDVASLGDIVDIQSHPIDTVSSVVIMPGHEDSTHDLQSILQSQENGNQKAAAFVALYCGKGRAVEGLEEVLAPATHARASLRVVQWIEESNRITTLDVMLYNVFMQTIGKLNTNILTNERMRLIRNLLFFMAYYCQPFGESPVLAFVVLRTATALTQQRDLAVIAINMIMWILPQFKPEKGSEPELIPLLAQLSSIARAYSTEIGIAPDNEIFVAVTELLKVLGSFLSPMWSQSRCPPDLQRSDFLSLLPIWPDGLPNEPSVVLQGMTRARLLGISQQRAIHDQVFLLADRLANMPDPVRERDVELFSSNVFWQMKDAIAEGHVPEYKETSAFLELCYLNGGRLRMVDSDTAVVLGSKFSSSPVRSSKTRSDAIQTTTDILYAILDRLSHADLGTMYRAYQTLCVVASRLLGEIQPPKFSKRLDREIKLLDIRPPDLRVNHVEFLDFVGVVRSPDECLQRPLNTDRWVTEFASVACLETANSGDLLVEAALLLRHDPQLSRQLLPHLLHLLLQREESAGDVSDPTISDAVSTYFKNILEGAQFPIATKKVIMEVLLYLRRQARPSAKSHLDNDKWLNLNFALLARVALDCKMYSTALLYWELHSDPDPDYGDKENAVGEGDYKLLYEIYNNIDEPDGFYGIPLEKHVKNSLLQRFQHESNWSLAFKYYGADLEANGASAGQLPQLTRSLQAFGMDKLAMMLFQAGGSSPDHNQILLPYNLAWRTQSWDLPTATFLPDSADRSVYTALRAIHRSRDLAETQRIVGVIEREEVVAIRAFSFEDVHGLRKKMKELLSLREIGRWCSTWLPMVNAGNLNVGEYGKFLEVPSFTEPEMTEQILSVRLSLIRSAKQQDEWQLGDMVASRGRLLITLERDCLERLGLLARTREDLNGAIKILAEQQSLTIFDAADHVSEFAEVLWLQGDHGLAIDQLKNILGHNGTINKSTSTTSKPNLNLVAHSKFLSRVGQWMAEAKQAHPDIIYRDYFVKAYNMLHRKGTPWEDLPSEEERALIYSRFASFSDQEYERLLTLSELEQRHLVQQQLATEVGQSDLLLLASGKGSTGVSARNSTQHGISGSSGEYPISKKFDEIRRYSLEWAIIMYAHSMIHSAKYDDSIHRLCALWLANSNNDKANIAVKKSMLSIPTHKFAFLASQLTARLDADDTRSVFQELLTSVLGHLCEQHPFHIMYQVITLARTTPPNSKPHTSSARGKPRGLSGRELAAFNLLARTKALDIRVAQIQDMELFENASVSWCEYKQDRGKAREYQIPASASIAGLKDLCIPVPTQFIPFDPTHKYARPDHGGPAYIRSYDRTFTLAGGLHMPKIMVCKGHDGDRYRQLFKADDDLRQDSVMEQVFSLVNTLLLRDEATARRELRFQTYTVLPLYNSTGIIEFVPDSIGIGDWLGDAHKRYRPSDITPNEFRAYLKEVQQGHSSNPNPELIRRFIHYREFFKPVMRHFFTDMRSDPIGWYSMRLKYARSVAVGSMVGHIVGLGDRHCSNMMINTKTGEILHIDLGIAFDQGAELAIPERVPFRLTADIVDGLGTFGVEGVFKRCCEQSLRLLRDKSNLIMAVLEVFKHDPLQRWKADANKVDQMLGGAAAKAHKKKVEAEASELATEALDRVRTKLLNTTSVEYTVNELIRTARDPANLATIFHGWQAWM